MPDRCHGREEEQENKKKPSRTIHSPRRRGSGEWIRTADRSGMNRLLWPTELRRQMVAGEGFEPLDLRVMSPTSYQTALPRVIDAPIS